MHVAETCRRGAWNFGLCKPQIESQIAGRGACRFRNTRLQAHDVYDGWLQSRFTPTSESLSVGSEFKPTNLTSVTFSGCSDGRRTSSVS